MENGFNVWSWNGHLLKGAHRVAQQHVHITHGLQFAATSVNAHDSLSCMCVLHIDVQGCCPVVSS